MSKSSAYNFINAAKVFGDKIPSLGSFSGEVISALASPSTPQEVRDEVIDKAKEEDSVTLKELKELKAKHQVLVAEATKTQQSLELQKNVLTQLQQDKISKLTKTANLPTKIFEAFSMP